MIPAIAEGTRSHGRPATNPPPATNRPPTTSSRSGNRGGRGGRRGGRATPRPTALQVAQDLERNRLAREAQEAREAAV